MKTGIKRLAVMGLMLMLMISMLAGCKSKPEPEDARAYVQAVLDLMCTGDYDHSIKLADIEEGQESGIRDSLIDEMITQISSESKLSEDVSASFKEFMINALAKAKYTVGDAVATEDGGYDVSVSIEPILLFSGVQDDLNAVLEERISADSNEILAMSQEEQTNYVMEILIELLNKNLEDPRYDEAEEVVVHYGPMEGEKDVYGCTEEEGEKLGAKLFSNKGL